MEKIGENPDVYTWHKVWIIKISDIGDDFRNWLAGQTLPLVNEDENPTDWAYYSDYSRWKQNLPIID